MESVNRDKKKTKIAMILNESRLLQSTFFFIIKQEKKTMP